MNLSVEDTAECRYDFLHVYDVGSETSKEHHFCGNTTPSYFTSKTNHVILHYHTDENDISNGFFGLYRMTTRKSISSYGSGRTGEIVIISGIL